MDPQVPVKFTNDAGLGHESPVATNKKKVSTSQKVIKGGGFISKVSRNNHFASKIAQTNLVQSEKEELETLIRRLEFEKGQLQ
jgi:hypothetical protein